MIAKPIFYIWKEDPGHVNVHVTITPLRVKAEIETQTTSSHSIELDVNGSDEGSSVKGTGEISRFSFSGPCMHETHFIVESGK